jgi:hypothetical protein
MASPQAASRTACTSGADLPLLLLLVLLQGLGQRTFGNGNTYTGETAAVRCGLVRLQHQLNQQSCDCHMYMHKYC